MGVIFYMLTYSLVFICHMWLNCRQAYWNDSQCVSKEECLNVTNMCSSSVTCVFGAVKGKWQQWRSNRSDKITTWKCLVTGIKTGSENDITRLCNRGLWDSTWPELELPCHFAHRWPWGCLHSGCCPAPLPQPCCSWSPVPSLHTLHRLKRTV